VADVQTAVRFATERNLPVAILVTGHQMVRSADGAVLINMSPDEHIDRGRSLARAVSGAPEEIRTPNLLIRSLGSR
jgi:FAD/FMN-containing dehydrogenase